MVHPSFHVFYWRRTFFLNQGDRGPPGMRGPAGQRGKKVG